MVLGFKFILQSIVNIMTTRAIGSYGNTFNSGYQSAINNLNNIIATGAVIQANHINTLIMLWNGLLSHVHYVSDLYGVHDYGNTDPYGYGGGAAQTTQTNIQGNKSALLNNVGVGSIIEKGLVNNMVSLGADGFYHNHYWPDRTS